MPDLILDTPLSRVARIPIFSGGASGEVYCMRHDPAYGRDYFAPFGVATKDGTSGQGKLEKAGIKVLVHPRPQGMGREPWTGGLVDLIERNLPSGYSMPDVVLLLTGSDEIARGSKFETVIGPRAINIHPAPLYVLTSPTGEIRDVYGMRPEDVVRSYTGRHLPKEERWKRRYTGWGEDIMPRILQERHTGASTTHIATKEIDHGPCIAVRHKVREPRHIGNPELFQSELKEEGDGPAIVAATHMMLDGLAREGETLYRKGAELPYQGHELKEGWEAEIGIQPMK